MNVRIMMLFAVLAIFVSLGFSATLVVNDSANCFATPQVNNYTSLSAALVAVGTAGTLGDTIYVCGNTSSGYGENVVVNVSVNIIGMNQSPSFGVWFYALNNSRNAFTVTASGVNISNLTITNASNSSVSALSGVYVSGENVSVFNNTLHDNVFGVYSVGYQSLVYNNSIYSNLDAGVALFTGTSYSSVYGNNMSQNYNYNIYVNTANNYVENNTIFQNYTGVSSDGIVFDTGANSNRVYNNVLHDLNKGIRDQGSTYNNYTSNKVYASVVGFYFNSGGTYANLTSNIFVNNTYGIWAYTGASNSNFISNILENSTYGFYVSTGGSSPTGLRFTTNRVYNNTYGVFFSSISGLNHVYGNTQLIANTYNVLVRGSSSINVTNNDFYNSSYPLVVDGGSSSNTVANNRISNSPLYALVLNGTSSDTISGNNLSNASTAALYMYGANESTFANNVLNVTAKGFFLESSSNLTFSGNNYVNVTSTGNEVYLNQSSYLSTGGYNITTSLFAYRLGDNTKDVAIKAVNADTALGVNSTNHTVSAVAGFSEFITGKILNGSANFYGALNVTNIGTSTPKISPYLFYDTGNVETYLSLGLVLYDTAYHLVSGSTGTNGVASAGGYTYSGNNYVMLFAYNSSSTTTTTTSSGSSTTVKSPSLTKSFDCKTGDLTVTVTYSGSGVSGMSVKLYNTKDYSQTAKTTDSNGKAVFTIKANGNYEVDSEASGSYNLQTLGPFELTLCPVETTTPATTPTTTPSTPEVTPEPETPTTPATTEETPVAPELRNEALAALASADAAVSAALSEGKDVTEAKAKLDQANAALTSGDYAKAKSLSEEAALLAKNAAAKPAAPTAPAPATTTPTATQPQKGLDLGAILIGLVVVIVVVLGVYFLSKGKTSKGHYKGHRRV